MPLLPSATPTRNRPSTTGCRGMGALGAALLTAGLLTGCGAPPEPLPTGPPRPATSGSLGASGAAYPGGISSGVPTVPGDTLPATPPGLPEGGLPGAGLPGGGLPPPAIPIPIVPTTAPPAPAPRCSGGPTAAQVLNAVRDRPGVPTGVTLKVSDGPYCAGGWQFATVELITADPAEKFDPLLVVTKGKPATLTLVEAGADVCSDRVQHDAPAGIRVRACGP